MEGTCGKASKRKLNTLRTDNGGEYTSNKFEKYLRDEGIRHERTVPKRPEQNGMAERFIRTLVESARSMLLDANLTKYYCAEAVSNRKIGALQRMTPYEAWHGHFRVSKLEAKIDVVFYHVCIYMPSVAVQATALKQYTWLLTQAHPTMYSTRTF